MNFKSLAAELLTQARTLLPEWLPGGSFQGKEYVCGSIAGGKGDSLKFNTVKGIGQDFASDDKFGDMIDLYAKINGISQGEAFKRLGGRQEFDFSHKEFGKPIQTWAYSNEFIVARYNVGDGKQFIPWRLIDGKWKAKFPDPRPLYGLDLLKQRPDAPVLIVEGEKCAEAARAIAPSFVVVTWAGGAKSWQKTDWQPIYGRKAAIWPDADEPGIAAARGIASLLAPKTTENAIKILDVSGKPDGWDAADARDMTPDIFNAWCKQTVYVDIKALIIQTPELTEESAPTESQQVIIDSLGLIVNEQGKAICNAANVGRYVSRHGNFKGHIWWDDFHSQIFTDLSGKREAWSDSRTVDLMIHLQNTLAMHRITSAMVYDGVSNYARTDRRHEVRDWMRSLIWDKTPRIGDFFTKYIGAEPSPAMSAFGNNFWVLMVKRTFNPGSKADYMVVLQGAQGLGKTSAFEIIGSPWYTECSTSVESEDFFRQLQGKLLVEIAELHAFSNADQTRIKQVITQRVDRYREKYGRIAIDHPRQGLLVGTTNEAEWIKDQTGGRRFWPVQCGTINLDLLRADRDQLFAEAVYRFNVENDEGYITPQEETAALQEAIRERDDWESILAKQLEYLNQVSQHDVLIEFLGIPIERIDGRNSKRVCRVLRKLGFETKTLRIRGEVERKWTRIEPLRVTEPLQNLPSI